MVRANPSCAATATRRHPALLSAASVATTAMVVLSGLKLGMAVGERSDLLGRRAQPGRTPRSDQPATATRYPVDGVTRGVDDHHRADRDPELEHHRRRADPALEHADPRARPRAHGPDGDVGACAASAAAKPNSAVGRHCQPPTGRSKITAAGTIGTTPPSMPRRGPVPRANASRRRPRPARSASAGSTTASTWRTVLIGSSRSVSRRAGRTTADIDGARPCRAGSARPSCRWPNPNRARHRDRADGDARPESRRRR